MPDPPLVCPYCDDATQLEQLGFVVYCSNCGRTHVPPTVPRSQPQTNTPPVRGTPPAH